MIVTEDKLEDLKELILQSRSFNENEKEQLLEKLPHLSEEEMNDAISIFKDEQLKGAKADEQDQKDLVHFQEFSLKSKKEIKTMSQDIIRKTEAEETEKENKEAEKLLKNI